MNIDFHFNEKLPRLKYTTFICYWFIGKLQYIDVVRYSTDDWECDLWSDGCDSFMGNPMGCMSEKELDESQDDLKTWPHAWAILPDFRKETNEKI
jgi:hypothetical protein